MPAVPWSRTFAVRWLCSWVVCISSGCSSLDRSPVAENVIESRQFSLLGMDAVQRGDWSKAEELFGRAIECCPADKLAHQRYAESLWRRGIRAEAIDHMETAIVLSGGDAALHVQLGEMYLALGSPQLAAEQVEQAVSVDPKSESAWALRGDVFRAQGQSAEAMMSYHRALVLQPQYPRVQLALCELYLQQDRPRRALSTIDSLAATFPPNSVPLRVLVLKGVSLRHLKRYSTALEVLASAAGRAPGSADLLVELAETQYLAGDPASAQLSLNSARALEPHNRRSLALAEQIRVALLSFGESGG